MAIPMAEFKLDIHFCHSIKFSRTIRAGRLYYLQVNQGDEESTEEVEDLVEQVSICMLTRLYVTIFLSYLYTIITFNASYFMQEMCAASIKTLVPWNTTFYSIH